MSKKNKKGATAESKEASTDQVKIDQTIMREFAGCSLDNPVALSLMKDFAYNLMSGNMDEGCYFHSSFMLFFPLIIYVLFCYLFFFLLRAVVNRCSKLLQGTASSDIKILWMNMAKLCVKTRRIDIMETCLRNMGNVRALLLLREAKQESPLEASLGMLMLHFIIHGSYSNPIQ
jgi:hypothetical protein